MLQEVKELGKYKRAAFIKEFKTRNWTIEKILRNLNKRRGREYLSVLFNKVDYRGNIIGESQPLIQLRRYGRGENFIHKMKGHDSTIYRRGEFDSGYPAFIKQIRFKQLVGWYPHIYHFGEFRPLFYDFLYDERNYANRLIDIRLWAFHGYKKGIVKWSINLATDQRLKDIHKNRGQME